MGGMPGPRVVVFAHMVPFAAVPHAGGQYLQQLLRVVGERAQVTLVAANTEANKTALASPGAPPGTLLVGREFGTSLPARALGWATVTLDRRLRPIDQGLPFVPYAVGVRTSAQVRTLVRSADVVDLQWEDAIRSVDWVRSVNPRARVVGMFHDVLSQSFAREVVPGRRDARYWQWQARATARRERALVAQLDVAAAFSAKDLRLLGSPRHGMVIRPPVSLPGRVHRAPASDPTVLSVAYWQRFENDEGARWLLEQVWPRVRARVPTARLRLVGAGASETLREAVATSPGAAYVGFVDDLAAEYAGAWAAVVPLRFGAGVKFKTVDALVRAVPVVTTPVGAEGIGDDSHHDQALFGRVSEDPAVVAAELVDRLLDREGAQARADSAAAWARPTYSHEAFVEAITAAYGWHR